MTARRIFLLLGVAAFVAQCIGLYGPPGPPSPPGVPSDKVGHLLVFAVPVALFLLARVDWRVVVGFFVVQALVSEVVQGLLLPDRTGDPFDLLADAVGIGLGCAVAAVLVAARRPSNGPVA